MRQRLVTYPELRDHGISSGEVRQGIPPRVVVPWPLPERARAALMVLLAQAGFNPELPIYVSESRQPPGFVVSQPRGRRA